MEEQPSIITDYYWIYADNLKLPRPRSHSKDKVGKWMFFVEKAEIDKVWEIIKKQTEQGFLGINAKVATAKSSARKIDSKHVICIYTKNYEDKTDINQIANNIRILGLEYDLFYKTNEATIKGNHSILYQNFL